jgi:hypothetical protein
MTSVQDMLRRLTDAFTKNPNSNLGKLMGILAFQINALEETLERVREWRGIDAAQGTTLDKIGANVGQARGPATDEVFRILIKSKIARNLSTGDVNTIIQVISTALDASPNDIEIRELYEDVTAPEPAAISLIRVPLAKINEVGLSPAQFARIVQRTVAAGVRVGVIELAGTFAFASGEESEEDPKTGFGDIDGTIGGYLGYAYAPESEQDLPI